jgi:hypothetical protein
MEGKMLYLILTSILLLANLNSSEAQIKKILKSFLISPETTRNEGVTYIGKSYFVLLDYSGSFAPNKDKYKDYLLNIFNDLSPGDRVFILKISSLSETEITKLFELGEKISAPNEYKLKQKLKELKPKIDSLKEVIFKELEKYFSSKEKTQWTDIRGTLRQVAQIKAENKMIFILSDMQEDKPNFRIPKLKLDDKMIQKVIERDKKEDLLPDLKNSTVTIIGINAPDEGKLIQIKKFWRKYLTEAGAKEVKFTIY